VYFLFALYFDSLQQVDCHSSSLSLFNYSEFLCTIHVHFYSEFSEDKYLHDSFIAQNKNHAIFTLHYNTEIVAQPSNTFFEHCTINVIFQDFEGTDHLIDLFQQNFYAMRLPFNIQFLLISTRYYCTSLVAVNMCSPFSSAQIFIYFPNCAHFNHSLFPNGFVNYHNPQYNNVGKIYKQNKVAAPLTPIHFNHIYNLFDTEIPSYFIPKFKSNFLLCGPKPYAHECRMK